MLHVRSNWTSSSTWIILYKRQNIADRIDSVHALMAFKQHQGQALVVAVSRLAVVLVGSAGDSRAV